MALRLGPQAPPHDDVVAVVVVSELDRIRQPAHFLEAMAGIEIRCPRAAADLQAQRVEVQDSARHRFRGVEEPASDPGPLKVGVDLDVTHVPPAFTGRRVIGGKHAPAHDLLVAGKRDEGVAAFDDTRQDRDRMGADVVPGHGRDEADCAAGIRYACPQIGELGDEGGRHRRIDDDLEGVVPDRLYGAYSSHKTKVPHARA